MTRARAAAKEDAHATKKATTTRPKTTATTRSTRTRHTEPVEEPQSEAEEEDDTMNVVPARRAVRTTAIKAIDAPPRRRIKVTPIIEPTQTTTTEAPEEPVKSQPKVRATRSTKTVDDEPEKFEKKTLTRSRGPKATTPATKDIDTGDGPAPPKGRGRQKKPLVAELQVEDKPARVTRTRAASNASTASEIAVAEVAPVLAAVPKTRKKVTFQEIAEEDDKENVPIVQARKRGTKAASKPEPTTTARTRAARKPAAAATTTTNTRARGTNNTTAGTKAASKPQPLSPKKATQVAKAEPRPSESDDEDELAGEKTPVRPMSMSPIKEPGTIRVSPAKKLDFGMAASLSATSRSPEKTSGSMSTVMLSPARRPPPTPFKDTLRESPKRAEAGSFLFPASPFKTIGTRPQSHSPERQTAHSKSTLQQSPKRGGALDISVFSASTLKPKNSSPMKASLMQSPPKRLLFSPSKSLFATTTGVSPMRSNIQEKTPAKALEEMYAQLSPDVAATSAFKTSRSPARLMLVDDLESATPSKEPPSARSLDFDESVLDVRSPMKLPEESMAVAQEGISEDFTSEEAQAEHMEEEVDADMQDAPEMKQVVDGAVLDNENTRTTSIVPEIVQPASIQPKAHPRSSVQRLSLFRYARGSVDDSSEDELQADETPVRRFQIPSKTPVHRAARSRLSTVNPADMSSSSVHKHSNVAFTPLVAQFSSWLAPSPDKDSGSSGSDSTMTPLKDSVAREAAGAVNDVTSPVPNVAAKKARKSLGGRKSLAPRNSLGASATIGGTPVKDTFFDDEMAVRELEEELDSVHGSIKEETATFAQQPAEELFTSSDEIMQDVMDEQIVAGGDEGVSMLNFEGNVDDTSMDEDENVDFEPDSEGEKPSEAVPAEGVEFIFENPEEPALGTEAVEAKEIVPAGDAVEEISEEVKIMPDEAAVELVQPHDDQEATLERHEVDITAALQAPLQLEDESAMSEDEQSIYGDENEQEPEQEAPAAATSASVAVEAESEPAERLPLTDLKTPIKPNLSGPRNIQTVVSKVPLRAEANDTSLQVPRKRSRSLSTGGSARKISPLAVFELPKSTATRYTATPLHQEQLTTPSKPTIFGQSAVATPSSSLSNKENLDGDDENIDINTPAGFDRFIASAASSPSRSTSRDARHPLSELGPLSGAVVYVDVHTSEGADASGIFIELLTEMSAKCVKSWSWNPRASIGGPQGEEGVDHSKRVGITHVVYKDGGKRTLEKVRDAGEVVKCVGVGWVLEYVFLFSFFPIFTASGSFSYHAFSM